MDTLKASEEEYKRLQGKDTPTFASVVDQIVDALPSAPEKEPTPKELNTKPKEVGMSC